jgi:fucose permease
MKINYFVVVFILLIWFVISFVTNILGPIMPAIIRDYSLSLTLASFLPFSFFLAYGIMSVPAGFLIEKIGGKASLLIAFLICFSGVFLFAIFPLYIVAIASLFIVGLGMAMLQVVINPMMRIAGGEENFAFFSVLGQTVFGGASFISPLVYIYLTSHLTGGDIQNFLLEFLDMVTPEDLPWSSLYWVFSLIFLIVIIAIVPVRLPPINLKEDEKAEGRASYIELIRKKHVVLYTVGIAAYVGTEQGLANFMSEFLNIYHNINPEILGAKTVSWFWGAMTIGCLLGLLMLKLIDSKYVLKIFAILALAALIAALTGSKSIAVIAFPLTGFFISVMFSIIFFLALNSETSHHGAFSGILCTGIFGGALVPFIIGWLGDIFGLKAGMFFIVVTMGYILSISFWAKPFIKNKIIGNHE